MLNSLKTESIWTNPLHFLACGFGSGASPIAPGTMGTIIAIPLYFLFADFSLVSYLILVAILFATGVYLCGITAKAFGEHDHASIVWDEITGYFITMIGLPCNWKFMLAGFVLFRLFDIWKPWPIRTLDRAIHGGLGIMLDDVVAGLISLAILQGINWIR